MESEQTKSAGPTSAHPRHNRAVKGTTKKTRKTEKGRTRVRFQARTRPKLREGWETLRGNKEEHGGQQVGEGHSSRRGKRASEKMSG